MGVSLTMLRAIALATRTRNIDFSNTVMLGRQEIFFTKEDFEFIRRRSGLSPSYGQDIAIGQFAEGLFRRFGANRAESIDASAYEGASIVHDFNCPVPAEMHEKYTAFVDFGSMEHVYNVPQVVDNVARLLRIGGSAFIVSQANGYAGHGFYQFSPEFFYSVFCESNGFNDTVVCLVDLQDSRRWFLIPEPRRIGGRNEIPQSRTYFIVCFATKVRNVEQIRAQQSDYQDDAWTTSGHSHMGIHGASMFSKVRHLFNPFLFQNLRGSYYAAKTCRAFRRQTVRFDPDLVSAEEFCGLIARR